MSPEATRIVRYLASKGYNSARETAQDCGCTEAALDQYLREIEDTERYLVHKAVRRESYGREVLWLERI
jgi:hypothetical protein